MNGAVAIAIDVGGTKVAAGLVDQDGRLAHRRVQPATAGDGDAQVAAIRTVAEGLRRTANDEGHHVAAVGIGVPELVDRGGIIRGDDNFAWKGLDLAQALTLGLPTIIESDVRAAATAEAQVGAGADFGYWLYVTIGTGVSGCLVTDGTPQPGARGYAIHLASSPIRMPGAAGDQAPRTLEQVASGTGVLAAAVATGADVRGAEDVIARAEAGDTTMTDVVTDAARAMGSGIALLVNATDPEAVVLGGGLGQAEGLYRDILEQTLREDIVADEAKDLPVRRAAAGADSGVIGAGLVALAAYTQIEEARER